ncbi:ABC transporter permease [Streptomyces sp. NPDC054962]
MTPARLSAVDVFHVGSSGLRNRPTRVALSALGIAIGIATMIAVVGVSSSSKAHLLQRLDRLGTNMLVATPGEGLFTGSQVRLPEDAAGRIARINGVTSTGATGDLKATVRRTSRIPEIETSGLTVKAASADLPKVLRGTLRDGAWFNGATGRYPTTVLGHVAAQRLGMTAPGQQVWIKNQWFIVLGILDPLPLAPDVERAALVGWQAAKTYLDFDGYPTAVFERSDGVSIQELRRLIAPTLAPDSPQNVRVSDPSEALQTKAAAEGAFNGLLLGLGAIALLVGGVGVANTMIISVLERRHEIGLRRSLGATRGQIRIQFVTESLLLSSLGGLAGLALGAAATGLYAYSSGFPWTVPAWAAAGGFAATLAIGTVAGLYPAVRAAGVDPTAALHAV